MSGAAFRWWLPAAAVFLAACSPPSVVSPVAGPPQGSHQGKADERPWDSAPNAWSHSTWKPGDRESWEEALRQRAQNQNEYERTN